MNQNESLFVHAFNHTPIGMALVAPDGRWLKVNPALCDMFGYSEQELLSSNFQAITIEEDLELDFEMIREALEGKIDSYTFEKRHYHQNGNIVWVSISSSLIRDEHGKPLYFLSQTEDITVRKKTTVQLRHLQKLSELISESEQDILIYLSPDFIYQYVSPSLKSILGYEAEEVVGKLAVDFLHPDDFLKVANPDIFQKSDVNTLTCRIRHKNGDYVWFENAVKVVRNEQGEIEKILNIARDITERMKVEEERIHTQQTIINSEKLSIVGQLAAGIAHEIRNPLTAVKGFLKLLERQMADNLNYFEILNSEINRIELIVNELLILAKPQVINYQKKDVCNTLEHVIALLESQALLKNVIIHTKFCEDEVLIHCDENQLKQVFINFIQNSIESMQNGGEILVNVARNQKSFISITIEDQGCGLSEEQLAKLGQPFFSTKETGTGLGFMVSKKIIESHNGTLHVTSKVNIGTKIEMAFPI
jgi:two-component system sporulation sensor kinase A